jgi:hypothetical protein
VKTGVFESSVEVVDTMYCQFGTSEVFASVFQMQALLGVSLNTKVSTFILSASGF